MVILVCMCVFVQLSSGVKDGAGDREGNDSMTKRSSLEMDQEKENLVRFHKSFHVCEYTGLESLERGTF